MQLSGLPSLLYHALRMKAVHTVFSMSRRAGGLFDCVRRPLQELSALGLDVSVFSVEDDCTAADRASWRPLSVLAPPVFGPRQFCYSPKTWPALCALNPDVLHCHGIWTHLSLAAHRFWRKRSRPYVISPQGMLDHWALSQGRWKKALANIVYQRAHLRDAGCLVAVCESEAHVIRKLGLTNPICVVPNGVDLPVLSRSDGGPNATLTTPGPRAAEVEQDRRVLLYLGRLHPKKGLPNLLRAWSKLPRQRHNEWLLAIAGWDQDGHEHELKALAAELGLTWQASSAAAHGHGSVQVLFLGPRFGKDRDDCYRGCAAAILPSYSEGMPMAVLEAWAHAKPVLMTAECNLDAGFAAGAAAKIPTEPDMLAATLSDFMSMRTSEHDEMGKRARALVQERFTWTRAAAELKAVYEWVLGDGPSPSSLLR